MSTGKDEFQEFMSVSCAESKAQAVRERNVVSGSSGKSTKNYIQGRKKTDISRDEKLRIG